CTPPSCAGRECGTVSACGQTLDCGSCSAGEVCQDGTCIINSDNFCGPCQTYDLSQDRCIWLCNSDEVCVSGACVKLPSNKMCAANICQELDCDDEDDYGLNCINETAIGQKDCYALDGKCVCEYVNIKNEGRLDIGGDVSGCCGDDPNEYYKTFNYPYAGFQDACCDAATDCVDVNGRCIEQGQETVDCDENGLCKIYVCGSGEISEVPVSRDDVCSKEIIDGVNYTLVGNEEFGFRWVDDFTLYNIQHYRVGEQYFSNASSGCGSLCGCFDYLDTDCDGLGDNLDSDCSLSNSVYDNMDWYIEVGRDRPIRNPEVIPEGWYPALGCNWSDFNPRDLSYCNLFYYFNKTWSVDLSKYPNFNNCNDNIDNDQNGCSDDDLIELTPESYLLESSKSSGALSTCKVEDVKFIYSKNSEPSKCPSGYVDLGYKLADNDPSKCYKILFWKICTVAENHYVRACIKTKDCCVDSYFKAGTDSCSSSAMKCPSGSSDYRKCSLIKDEGLFDDNSYAVVCLNLANRGSCEDDSKGCNSLGEFVECSDDTVCRSGACVPNTEDFIPSVLNFSRTGLSSTPVGRRLGDFKCGASEFEAAKRDLSYMLDGIDNDCNGWIDYGYPPNIKRESWKTDGNVEYPADFTDLMPEPGSKMHVKVIVEDSEGNRVKDANVTFYFNTEYRPDLEIPRDYWTAFTDESGEAEFYLNKGFKYNIHVVPPKETGLNEKIIPLRINLGMSDTEITTHITLLGSALAENCNSDCTWGDTNKCDARCAGYNGCKMSGLLLDLCDGKEKGGHSEGNTLFVCCDGSVLETSEDNNEVKVSAPVLKTPDWSSMVLSDQLRVALYDKPVKMKMVLFR
ncbi:MAG: hypothetical protein PWR32_754, partial [Candidatus Woesearchaeota archaeon]|nr:hypothetical protein [Candidatus Woesearchaeota archaeon]